MNFALWYYLNCNCQAKNQINQIDLLYMSFIKEDHWIIFYQIEYLLITSQDIYNIDLILRK